VALAGIAVNIVGSLFAVVVDDIHADEIIVFVEWLVGSKIVGIYR
jgi:hypothetical protein